MAGTLNKVTLIGNLGRDPEISGTRTGERVVTFSLATSEGWRDKQSGERRERVEWHRVAIFNPRLSEVAEQYLRKGSKVYVEGSLRTRKWADTEGRDRYSTEIVLGRFEGALMMLDGALRASGEAAGTEAGEAPRDPAPAPLDDEIPF